MEQSEFNLLREPWIRVMLPDARIEEHSLTDTLLKAHTYRALGGELPTQDVAILRLLLAVLHTVFSRVDENGQPSPLEEKAEALRRWKALWERGSFPEAPIRNYLDKWQDRFWLFDKEHPFYQVPEAENGTAYGASKLNGEISESSNREKVKVFLLRSGVTKDRLTYSEAARWLITLNAFDDSSTKVCTGTGSGWLGSIGNVYTEGDNLFKTLMLNLVLLKDGISLWEEENRPAWERNDMQILAKREIAVPENQAELLTLQSRRTLLYRKDGYVVQYRTAGGDYFSSIAAFSEQMTLWYTQREKPGQSLVIQPLRLNPSRQMWRDFGKFVVHEKGTHQIGLVQWINQLYRHGYLTKEKINFHSIGVCYDKKGSSTIDIVSDYLGFYSNLLTEQAEAWTSLIERQIEQCEAAANIIGYLSDGLSKAAGGDRVSKAQYAKERFFAEIDLPFRNWLMSIEPNDGDDEEVRENKEATWRVTAYQLARRLGREMVEEAGDNAYIGREISEGTKGKEDKHFYSSPKVYNIFIYQIKKCFGYEAAKEVLH